ncbi:hypothetical protein LINGRAHAP2_LOCUS8699 [Linum grandiflorum]
MIVQLPPPPLVINHLRPTMSSRNFNQQQPPVEHIHLKMINMGEVDLPTTSPSRSSANLKFMRQQPIYNHKIQHLLITNNGSGITVGENRGSMIEDSIWATQTAKHLKIIPSNADGSKWFSRWSHHRKTMTFHHHRRQ